MTTSTSRSRQSVARGAVRLLVPTTLVGLVLAAGPAFADVPVGWGEPVDVSLIDWLKAVVGPGILVCLIVAGFVLVPGFARGEGFLGRDEHADDQWFGGPRTGADELPAGDEPKAVSGGAGGTW